MTDAALWSALIAELDLWAESDRHLALWLRDDDATAPSAQLERLNDLAEGFAVPVLLASIPMLAQEALARRLEHAPLLHPCQHGNWHRNHAPAGEKKSEFGRHRPASEVLAEIDMGRQRLHELFGERALPVFVPPWNRIDPAIAAGLPELGFTGLSCFRNFGLGPAGGPRLVNSDLDLIDWHHGRIGRPTGELLAEMVALLRDRRNRPGRSASFGLLLHHHDHDSAAWNFLTKLLTRLRGHAAVAFPSPDKLFAAAAGLD